MNFPDQELWSVEDVAVRWGKPVSYVKDLTRRGVLSMNQGFVENLRTSQGLRLRITALITLQDLETFEREHTDAPVRKHGRSIKEYAQDHHLSEKTVRRRIHAKTVDARKIDGRWIIFE